MSSDRTKQICLWMTIYIYIFILSVGSDFHTTWTLTKRLKKKLDGNYTRMLRAILNKSWRQHPTMHQLYGHLPPVTKTIQIRRTRHAGHCWRSKDELISDVLLWTPAYSQPKAGRPVRTYIQQLCEDTGCSPEDLPEAMNNMEKWRERVRDIRASGTTWWYIYIYGIYIFNSWNIVCNSGFHEFFCKTTINRQWRRWNELKIENTKNTDKKPLRFRLCVLVCVSVYVGVCVCVYVL